MSHSELVGMILDGKYKLEKKIGEGGMGAVYLGVQMMVDRPVAVKVLHASLASHEKLMQRFEVEAKAIGRMNHPNCVTLYDFGFSHELGAFFMVMEYLDGTPMQELIGAPLTPQDIIDLTRQIALALDHAHHHKILHRDLKPENVMVTTMTDGTMLAKVLDFGIARIFQGDEDTGATSTQRNRLTQAGEIFGTPAYISPEQARGEQELKPSSDLYSLGIMLYELIQGDLPFWGETPIDTIMQHINTPIPAITRIDIPNGLKEVAYALMSKRADGRPQSGKELADLLSGIDVTQHTAVAAATTSGFNPHASSSLDTSVDIISQHELLHEWNSAEETMVDPPMDALTAMAQPSAPSNSGIYPRNNLGHFGEESSFDTTPDLELQPNKGRQKALLALLLGVTVLFGAALLSLAITGSGSDAAENSAKKADVPNNAATKLVITPETKQDTHPVVEEKEEPPKVESKPALKERVKKTQEAVKKTPKKKNPIVKKRNSKPKVTTTPKEKPPKKPTRIESLELKKVIKPNNTAPSLGLGLDN